MASIPERSSSPSKTPVGGGAGVTHERQVRRGTVQDNTEKGTTRGTTAITTVPTNVRMYMSTVCRCPAALCGQICHVREDGSCPGAGLQAQHKVFAGGRH